MRYRLPLDAALSELIIAPFHDPEHSHWLTVASESASGHELTRDTLWDSTAFYWQRSDEPMSATLKIFCDMDDQNYDQLIVSVSLPKTVRVRGALIAASGKVTTSWSGYVSGTGQRQELVYKIAKFRSPEHSLRKIFGRRPAGIALQIESEPTEAPVIAFSWIGLRNSKLYNSVAKLQGSSRPDWNHWILPDSYWGEMHFEQGLLFDAADLVKVRDKLNDPAWRTHFDLLEARAADYLRRDPEADFGSYLPTHDARYIRADQRGRACYHWEALVLAFVGLVNEDQTLIRHALRYLMCMVHTRYWTESAEHNVASSTWSHLSFQEEMTTTSVAILLDWLGFALFPRTKNLIRQSLAEKGMAKVAKDLSSHEAMHHMNQGAVFNRALILGGLMLEKEWPRYGTHTVDAAYSAMTRVLDEYIKPDGGVHEGIGYLCQTMTATLWAIIAYSRARGQDWREQVSHQFAKVDRYVATMSAMSSGKGIPAGDCRVEWFGGDALPIMAALMPDSSFAGILQSCLTSGSVFELTGTLSKSGGLIGMVYGPESVQESRPVVPPFSLLPQSAKISTLVGGGDAPNSRLWVSGSVSGATHSHRDVGQFTLEVENDFIFVDRGMVQYWFAEAHFLSKSWLHNVLTPIFENGDFVNQGMPSNNAQMTSSIDDKAFVVPGNGIWNGFMSSYERRFSLPDKSRIQISDIFSLEEEGTVAFHLHSTKPFEINLGKAVLQAEGYRVSVSFPWASEVSCVEALIDLAGRTIFHICAKSKAIKGDTDLVTLIDIEH